jgi:vitamin B12 transporter
MPGAFITIMDRRLLNIYQSRNAAPTFYISSHAKLRVNFNAQYRCKRFGFYLKVLYKNREPQSTPSPAIAKFSKDNFLLNAKAESYWWQQKSSVLSRLIIR